MLALMAHFTTPSINHKQVNNPSMFIPLCNLAVQNNVDHFITANITLAARTK
jgi:hypothetical protein